MQKRRDGGQVSTIGLSWHRDPAHHGVSSDQCSPARILGFFQAAHCTHGGLDAAEMLLCWYNCIYAGELCPSCWYR